MARFILSKSKVIKQYEKVQKISDSVSYSVKTNHEVAKILEESSDCFFSMHTGELVDLIKNKKRVWFFVQGNKDFPKEISQFVVDNINDLNNLIKFIKKENIEINLLLRMKLKEHTIHTGKHFVFGMGANKINELIPKLKENKNINRIGIHFHRKTQNISEWSLQYELEQSLSLEVFEKIDILNIGGGLPIEYKNYKADTTLIFDEILKLKKWLNEKNIKIIVEPGRFIAGPSIELEAKIINIYDNNIIIDCSVYNAAMDTFIAHIRLKVEGELEQGRAFTIKGCTPDSMDIFRYKVILDNPKIGDKIIFLNAGAYNFWCDFCNLKKLKTVIE